MDKAASWLSRIGAEVGAFIMLAATAAYAVSRDPIALLAVPVLVSIMQLLCLVEGPWTAPIAQRLPRRAYVQQRVWSVTRPH
ncbi:MAG TPA: hypothetical protein VFZ03_11220 [Dongiaceae bacterium]